MPSHTHGPGCALYGSRQFAEPARQDRVGRRHPRTRRCSAPLPRTLNAPRLFRREEVAHFHVLLGVLGGFALAFVRPAALVCRPAWVAPVPVVRCVGDGREGPRYLVLATQVEHLGVAFRTPPPLVHRVLQKTQPHFAGCAIYSVNMLGPPYRTASSAVYAILAHAIHGCTLQAAFFFLFAGVCAIFDDVVSLKYSSPPMKRSLTACQ